MFFKPRVLLVTTKTDTLNCDFLHYLPDFHHYVHRKNLLQRFLDGLINDAVNYWDHITVATDEQTSMVHWQEKPYYSREKPVQAPLCPPQIPHKMAWDRTCGDRPETNWKELVLNFKTDRFSSLPWYVWFFSIYTVYWASHSMKEQTCSSSGGSSTEYHSCSKQTSNYRTKHTARILTILWATANSLSQ
jgi:hypothetical protein